MTTIYFRCLTVLPLVIRINIRLNLLKCKIIKNFAITMRGGKKNIRINTLFSLK